MFQVFPVHSPEATTEIVVWKRYKDFNKLHKNLSLLHKNLHRPGVFPDFPKPRLFGELVVDHSHTHMKCYPRMQSMDIFVNFKFSFILTLPD